MGEVWTLVKWQLEEQTQLKEQILDQVRDLVSARGQVAPAQQEALPARYRSPRRRALSRSPDRYPWKTSGTTLCGRC